MHGEIVSFWVGRNDDDIYITVTDPSEGTHVTVKTTRAQLAYMAEAEQINREVPVRQTVTPSG